MSVFQKWIVLCWVMAVASLAVGVVPVVSSEETRVPYRESFNAQELYHLEGSADPFDLRVEYRKNPLGIDLGPHKKLRVSWKIPFCHSSDGSAVRGQRQTAYQIQLFAMSVGGKQIVWDSGKVESADQHLIPLETTLVSRTKYCWAVRVWDGHGTISNWSSPATFEMALLSQDDWQKEAVARWITSDIVPEKDDFVTYWEDSARLSLLYRYGKTHPGAPVSSYGDFEDYEAARKKAGSKFEQVKAPVYFRKGFCLDAPPVRARLYICGLGFHIPYLNGEQIGEQQMGPNFVSYDQRAWYQTYDVTDQLAAGENCIGAVVAPGRYYEAPGNLMWPAITYGPSPILIARLEVEMEDGSVQVIATDTDWETGSGGYRRTSFWIGEAFDATREPIGWNTTQFNEEWDLAQRVQNPPPRLEVDRVEPVQPNCILRPIERYNPLPGVWVYDFGKMISGRARIQFDLPSGEQARIRYADLVYENARLGGSFFDDYEDEVLTSQSAKMLVARHRGTAALFEKLKKADGREEERLVIGTADAFRSNGSPYTYMANFCYNGFRYIEVSTVSEPPALNEVEAVGIYSSLEPVGQLQIADPFLQKVHDACVNSITMNTLGFYQDNPGAEKLGSNAMTPMFFYDIAHYTANHALQLDKSMEDNRVRCRQIDMPFPISLTLRMVPQAEKYKAAGFLKVNNNGHHSGVPLRQYVYHGDQCVLTENLDVARMYFDYFFRSDLDIRWEVLYPRGTSTHMDWTSARDVPGGPWSRKKPPTSERFGRVGCLLAQAEEFRELCELTGRLDLWDDIAEKVNVYKQQAIERFYDKASNRFSRPRVITQETDIYTIKGGLLDAKYDQALVDGIVENMHKATRGHQVVSVKSPYWYFQLLSRFGHNEEALRLLRRSEYPSLGGMLKYTGWTVGEGWGFPDFSVGNSFIQGEGIAGAGSWFYTELVGIHPDVEQPGFKRFHLAPIVSQTSPDYSFEFRAPRGVIASRFSRTDAGGIDWEIVVPPNTEAVVTLPVGIVADWQEGDGRLDVAEGVVAGGVPLSNIEYPKQCAEFVGKSQVTLGSGMYYLTYTPNRQ